MNRADLRMPTICEDCYVLLEYVVSQLGDPKQALQTIYNALNLYFDMIKRQKQFPIQVQEKQETTQPQPKTSQTNLEGIDEETLELAKKLKILKQAGLI